MGDQVERDSESYSDNDPFERGSEALIDLVMRARAERGKVDILQPGTGLGHSDPEDRESREREQTYLREKLVIPDYDVSSLIDALYRHNAKSTQLTLQPSPDAGYVVDYASRYRGYFEASSGGGWEKLRADHPVAGAMTVVSMPVVDVKKNIVLIYVGAQSHWLAGQGLVIAYRFEGGKLIELARAMTWVS